MQERVCDLVKRFCAIISINKWRLAKYFLFILDFVAACASFAGVLPFFGVSEGRNVFFLVLGVVFAAGCISIFFLFRSERKSSINEAIKYSDCFHVFMHNLRNMMITIDDYGSREIDARTFWEKVVSDSKELMDIVANNLSKATSYEIRACVKLFCSPINQKQLITFVRSNTSTDDILQEHFRKIKLEENTDFDYIFKLQPDADSSETFFYQENLVKYAKHNTYKNSDSKWRKKYRTTVVLPIRHLESQNEQYDVLGFLCVDSMSIDAFSSHQRPFIIPLLKGLADSLYTYFDLAIDWYDSKKESSSSESEAQHNE